MNGAPTTMCAELRRNCAAPHFHFVLISYCCATFSFRAYVHTSSSGEIAAAGTAASAQYALRPWSATPTSSGDSDAFRAKKSQFFTKSVITDEPKVKWSVVPAGGTARRCANAASFSSRLLFSGCIHLGSGGGVPSTATAAAAVGGGADAAAAADAATAGGGLAAIGGATDGGSAACGSSAAVVSSRYRTTACCDVKRPSAPPDSPT